MHYPRGKKCVCKCPKELIEVLYYYKPLFPILSPQNIIAQYRRIYAYCDHHQISVNQTQTLVQSIIVTISSTPPTGRSGVAVVPQDNQDSVDVIENEDKKGHFCFIL